MKKLKQRFGQYARIFKGVKLPWVMLVVVLLIYIVESELQLKSTTLTADIIDGTQQAIRLDKLVDFILVMLGTAAVGFASTYLSNWTYEKINLGVRNKLWNKLMHLPARYYDGESGDTLVSRVTTDASQSYIYFQVVINLITAVYAAVVALRQMLKYSPVLTGYMMFIVPVIAVMGWGFGKLNFIAGKKTQVSFSRALGYLVERTRNLRLIKAARMEYAEQQTAKALFHNQFKASIWGVFSNSSSVILIELLSAASMIVTFVVGRNMVTSGEITIGKLLGFYTISSMLAVRLIQLMLLYGQLKQGNGRMEKISEILDASEEKRDGTPLDIADSDIIAENVAFSYDARTALQDVSFRIPKGRITAIIGSNGAGKSTVFKLLERMYDPAEGQIRFGDTDVRSFDLTSWRQSFAIVSQDKPLLSGTVRENILYGVRRKVSDEELEHVAKLANIYDFLMATPGGFDAQVGVNGSNFSGGQRQCIAIARAMMRNPDYLLLDEATSNLDAKSEQMVSQALKNLMAGRTTVMIAHNYSAVRDADHIIVMKDGKVEAEGTPEELMQTNEYYRTFATKAG